MTFRELLDKYRAGQASEEERALVEAELEKSEAIADYLAEQVEDALGAAETQAPAGEVRHIQKKVNRRLRRTAVWAACIVLAVLLGVRFVVSPWCRPCTISQTPTRWAEWKIARRTLLWRRTAWR
ncbi:MAG: hypothetical protein ACLRNQ_22710 [Flavonifractor plautii]